MARDAKKIYLRNQHEFVEASTEQYQAYYRPIWAQRKRAQAHGECRCEKQNLWRCDGDCFACPYHQVGDMDSLNDTFANEEGEEIERQDTIAVDQPAIDSILFDAILLDELQKRLNELDPDGRRICQLIMMGIPEREAAAAMGLSRNGYTYRRDKVLAYLKSVLKDYR